MKRHIFLTLLCLLAISSAHAFEVSGIAYEVTSDTTVQVVENWPLYRDSVAIPATVNYQGATYHVTGVARQAFADCTELTAVSLPSGMLTIGHEAFMGCTSLKSCTMKNTVTEMGIRTFANCSALESVTLSTALTEIPYGAFINCTQLQEVKVPKKVITIGGYAFYNSGLRVLRVGSKVKAIEPGAFLLCNSLNQVHISSFKNWCKIDFIADNENPIYYARNIYAADTLVTHLIIPDGVTEIKSHAFVRGSYTALTLPETVTTFAISSVNRSSLRELILPDGVTHITPKEPSVAMSMLNLTRVAIGSGVKEIPAASFTYCNNLSTLSLSEGLECISESAFSRTAIERVTLPASLKELKASFGYCDNLTSVTLGPNLRLLEGGVFAQDTKLAEIHCQVANPAQIEFRFSGQFTNVPVNDCVLYVPRGTEALYRAHSQWKVFTHIVEESSTIRGDINGDGITDVTDVNMVIDMVLGNIDFTPAADLNGDGIADVSDVSLIIDIVLGK